MPFGRPALISVLLCFCQNVTVQSVNTEGSVEMSVYPIHVYDEADASMLSFKHQVPILRL